MPAPPVALTIAGSDSCGGAGIQADLKTFSAFGVHGLTAVTAVVAESPRQVRGIYPVTTAALREQVEVVFAAYPIAAIKTGMLGSPAHVVAVADLLEGCGIPIVVDPVMVASTGDALASRDVIDAYRSRLFPLASLITPNLPEARALLGSEEPTAPLLTKALGCPVLLKGGHQTETPEAVDVFADPTIVQEFRSPWVSLPSAHGTGCTYAAAITAGLALGKDLLESIGTAKEFILRALSESYCWHHEEELEATYALNQLPSAFFGSPPTK